MHSSIGFSSAHRRPEEIDALEEAQEQRRVAERRQRAADVGDQEDEEHDHVRVVQAVVVGADDGRISSIAAPVVPVMQAMPVPMASSAVLSSRRAVQVALDQHAARDREQRQDQDDEGDELAEHRVHEFDAGEVGTEDERARDEKRQRPAARRSCRSGDARASASTAAARAIDSSRPANGTAHQADRPAPLREVSPAARAGEDAARQRGRSEPAPSDAGMAPQPRRHVHAVSPGSKRQRRRPQCRLCHAASNGNRGRAVAAGRCDHSDRSASNSARAACTSPPRGPSGLAAGRQP